MQFPKKKDTKYYLFKPRKTPYEKLVDKIKNTRLQGYKLELTHGTFSEVDLVLVDLCRGITRIYHAFRLHRATI